MRDTRERVRIGRALRDLPELERAFIAGALSYSRVREVTRVATPETERDWLWLAERLDMRTLERRVAEVREEGPAINGVPAEEAREPRRPHSSGPIRTEWTTSKTVRVTVELSAETWALLERAMAGAHRLATDSLTFSEALDAVARDALSQQNEPADASDPRCSVVVYTCKRCDTSELDTGSGATELDGASAAAMTCGATTIDLEREGHGARKRGGPMPAAVRRAVLLRDRCTCRVPGCNRRRYVDVHHLTPQASGGAHSRKNCVVLCTTHHRLLHEGKIGITGNAEGCLEVRDASGALIGAVATLVAATRRRSRSSDGATEPAASAGVATQGGSWKSGDATEPARSDAASPEETRLLQLMRGQRAWTMDALVEQSRLPASTVSSTLLLLELGRRVRNRGFHFELA